MACEAVSMAIPTPPCREPADHSMQGCATNLVRTTPAAALTFTSFELIARALKQNRTSADFSETRSGNVSGEDGASSASAYPPQPPSLRACVAFANPWPTVVVEQN
ncbi:uncharacterized protein HaLaN_18697 [Haematococcus lacustris]|uniref:Uncharacterized protein n=1 Tax=Haematococcus lacustris TaxID=44745 RepID=A0A699ZFA7_HAELA|nr:uncharacterized protein HaLaN_18697 [Haematococcus lacustris]